MQEACDDAAAAACESSEQQGNVAEHLMDVLMQVIEKKEEKIEPPPPNKETKSDDEQLRRLIALRSRLRHFITQDGYYALSHLAKQGLPAYSQTASAHTVETEGTRSVQAQPNT